MSPCATRSFTPIVFLCACIFFVAPPSAGAASDDPQTAIAAVAAPVSTPGATALKRPAALPALYVSFAGLQALDIHSTLTAIDRGAHEANPIVASTVGSPAMLIGLKAGATAGVVFATERLWKRHPAAAIVLMCAVNSAYAAIVAHNYTVAR